MESSHPESNRRLNSARYSQKMDDGKASPIGDNLCNFKLIPGLILDGCFDP